MEDKTHIKDISTVDKTLSTTQSKIFKSSKPCINNNDSINFNNSLFFNNQNLNNKIFDPQTEKDCSFIQNISLDQSNFVGANPKDNDIKIITHSGA